MKDTFAYKSPFGVIGKIVDILVLERNMRQFLINRSNELKRIAEMK
jgi:hypothetical protein